jgi:hypothetical protein
MARVAATKRRSKHERDRLFVLQIAIHLLTFRRSSSAQFATSVRLSKTESSRTAYSFSTSFDRSCSNAAIKAASCCVKPVSIRSRFISVSSPNATRLTLRCRTTMKSWLDLQFSMYGRKGISEGSATEAVCLRRSSMIRSRRSRISRVVPDSHPNCPASNSGTTMSRTALHPQSDSFECFLHDGSG